MLTSYEAQVVTRVPELKRLIAAGKVGCAFLNSTCGRHFNPKSPACSAPVRWVAVRGTDVLAQAGLSRARVWLLPAVRV